MEVSRNTELNGVEVSFGEKPDTSVLETLKAAGFRWHNQKKMWYAKYNEKTQAAIASLVGVDVTPAEKAVEKETGNKNKLASLWERTTYTKGDTDVTAYDYRFVGSRFNPKLTDKEIAAIIRTHLRARFPEVKWSVTIDHNSIYVYIVSSPYPTIERTGDKEKITWVGGEKQERFRDPLKAILEYAKAYVRSYNYDNSDLYTDYFDVNFYSYPEIDYEYTQKPFSGSDEIAEEYEKTYAAAKAESEQAYAEWCETERIRRDEQHRLNQIAEEQRKVDCAEIEKDAVITELPEHLLMVNCLFPYLNKNDTLAQYEEQLSDEKDYAVEDAVITHTLRFSSRSVYEKFAQNFLSDFSFFGGHIGGGGTNDPRFTSTVDIDRLPTDERYALKYYRLCVAVTCENDDVLLLVDPEGYQYARYVGFPPSANISLSTVEKEAGSLPALPDELKAAADEAKEIEKAYAENPEAMCEYFEHNVPSIDAIRLISEALGELKRSAYTFLDKYNSVKDIIMRSKLVTASVENPISVTLAKISEFGFMSTTVMSVVKTATLISDGKEGVKLIAKLEHKRGLYSLTIKPTDTFVIMGGKVEIPDDVSWETVYKNEEATMRRSRFMSFDKGQVAAVSKYCKDNSIEIVAEKL